MHLQRFLRPTVKEALAAARLSLGPQALVLSTELVQAPGWRGWTGQRVVALTAATDRQGGHDVSVDRTPEAETTLAPVPRSSSSTSRAGLMARLTAVGMDAALAEATAGQLSPSDCRSGSPAALRRAIIAAMAVCADTGAEPSRVEVFIGPPGVGKTTTIAKITAQEKLAGRDPRGVIAADSSRIGAVEHIRGYAAIIGSPLRIARNGEELIHAIKAARRPVLVDTPGRLPSDPALGGLLNALRSRQDVITHLVLAADTSAASAARILDRYADAQPNRVVITKIDEAESTAPLLGVLCERRLPVSYLAMGPRVPNDLVRATADELAAVMLGEQPQGVVTCH